MNNEAVEKSTEFSTLQYFCSLSTDEEILSEKPNNKDDQRPKEESASNNNNCLHSNFWFKQDYLPAIHYEDEVIDMAFEIASAIELKHPGIRPYISLHLMKKYFKADIKHQKLRDHTKCTLH